MFKRAIPAALALLALADAGPALAQQMGRDPWAFPTRDHSFSAQSQMVRRQQQATQSSTSGGSAGDAFVTYEVNTSTSIGNLNEISQILGDGANGTVVNDAGQTNTGNTSSTADSSTNTNTNTTTRHRHWRRPTP
ncbi:MAG: hypothetical protein HY985_16880 [Magnetospirillum sp.]|nr:hypothetical protein [Magnetospirillum sp.]